MLYNIQKKGRVLFMLRPKEELESYLKKEFYKNLTGNKKLKEICAYNNDVYDIPKSITSDYLSLRKPLIEANSFILFCLLDAIENVNNRTNSKIPEFFVEKEIKTYSKAKFDTGKIKFPLRFKMIQITEEQWIGYIDFNILMKLRAAQLIVYNEETQRAMQRVVRGEDETWKIAIKESSVVEIAESYENESYIPTPLTFNIPEDVESDFYYDENTCELVINTLDHFDITDGYHRYVSACRVCDKNDKFNYPMELRITAFTEEKAKHFIFQEDKKTKMKKMDSSSYNMNDDANIIVRRINSNSLCNIRGCINNNKGLINAGQLSDLIRFFYFKGIKVNEKGKRNQIIVSVSNDLIESFNMLTEYDSKYLDTSYTYKSLVVIITCFNHYKDKDKSNMCNVIKNVEAQVKSLGNVNISTRASRLRFIKEIRKILLEVQ